MNKIGAFFKKVGSAIASGFKAAWNFVKNIPWTKAVNPIVAWCVYGGCAAALLTVAIVFACI